MASVGEATAKLETIPCPNCKSAQFEPWAEEIGFRVVRCASCRLLYVNPRLPMAAIDKAVQTGAHGEEAGGLIVTSRRSPRRVTAYYNKFKDLFADKWAGGQPIRWLDVGAGYGEIVEAVSRLAPPGSVVEGLEPMKPKADAAKARGLAVKQQYLSADHPKVDVVSTVDVFSHIPDFDAFLGDVRAVLAPGGEVFVETGNLADIENRNEFPDELGVPDHLVFAGEAQITQYLERAGFSVVDIRRSRLDTLESFVKGVAKKILGRNIILRMPYTSSYRSLLIRAKFAS
ncbi:MULTISPECIES: bifunctional 2-polyprenyl-6-hydroxyphenol methylase/3-demethylubiquinol 3-O-methyltransferase UbiG [unclassified Sphingomonas]|uniref:class I SAM-dependent methyltransferase n=1 Tax=unclassified Sphingomonas TaxID=196159 RepID=UPI0021514B15|nr:MULTISPECIES: class I SAM-dependent methyltransferase [unclassified Sphingomonas]MCR5871125.1 class I SAM-dependent methyltransferase [Sphingomonas sp. J344]UUY00561.1 class I SAM-dependent methyltransferase [Sphingomonas sp. J315]